MSNRPVLTYGEFGRNLAPKGTLATPVTEVRGPSLSLNNFLVVLGLGGFGVAAYYGIQHWKKLREETKTRMTLSNASRPQNQLMKVEEVIKKKLILYQCPRGYTIPCISPFPLKLETYLRVAGIAYEVQLTNTNFKSPWMTYDGKSIGNAQDCIPFLRKEFGIDLEVGARVSRSTASRLIGVMLENHINWGIVLWRWIYNKAASVTSLQPQAPLPNSEGVIEFTQSLKNAVNFTDLRGLPYDKVFKIIADDFADLSAALGKHPFFLGETPGEIDCTAFAMLAQILWTMPSSRFEAELRKYKNLVAFEERMREKYWSDWNDVLSKDDVEVDDTVTYAVHEFDLILPRARDKLGLDSPVNISLEFNNDGSAESGNDSVLLQRSENGSPVISGTPVATKSRRGSVHFRPANEGEAVGVDPVILKEKMKEFDQAHQIKNVQDLLTQLKQSLEPEKWNEFPNGSTSGEPSQSSSRKQLVDNNFTQLSRVQSLVSNLTQALERKKEQRNIDVIQGSARSGSPNQIRTPPTSITPPQIVHHVPWIHQEQFPSPYVASRVSSRPQIYYPPPNYAYGGFRSSRTDLSGYIPSTAHQMPPYPPANPLLYYDGGMGPYAPQQQYYQQPYLPK